MNFDQSLHQANLVRNLIIKCALPVLLLAIVGAFVLFWTDEAIASVTAAGALLVKWAQVFCGFIDPWVAALNKTEFWVFVVTYLWLLQPIALPLFLICVCGTLIVGCALNKLKLMGITDQRYKKIVKIWKALVVICMPLSLIAMLVESNCSHNDLLGLFRAFMLLVGAVLIAIHVFRVEKVNGDLFKPERSNEL